jgi:hypothetical protein
LLTHNGSNEVVLGGGAAGQLLTSNGTTLSWEDPQVFNSNVLLNSYRTATYNNLPVLKIIDGAIDAFKFVTGVDGANSSSATYNPTGDFYSPTITVGAPVPAVKFDGSSTYLSKNSTNGPDSKKGMLSFWFKWDGTPVDNSRIMNGTSGYVDLYIRPSQKGLIIRLSDANGTLHLRMFGTTPIVSDTLYHAIWSWDVSSGAARSQFYLNGVDDENSSLTVNSDGSIDWSRPVLEIGRSTGGAFYSKMETAQFYLNTSDSLDLSNASELAKFIDSNGNPVDLGVNGSIPTGSPPILFLNNTLSTWQTNLGSGGGFTGNGTLTAGTDLNIGGSGTENMTLVSNSQTAKAQPNQASTLLMAKDVNANLTLNTDIKASVSRDGGTTFTQVTLQDAGEFEDGNLLTGTIDLASQPSGTDMAWKVETDNNKELNLHGVGLEWR